MSLGDLLALGQAFANWLTGRREKAEVGKPIIEVTTVSVNADRSLLLRAMIRNTDDYTLYTRSVRARKPTGLLVAPKDARTTFASELAEPHEIRVGETGSYRFVVGPFDAKMTDARTVELVFTATSARQPGKPREYRAEAEVHPNIQKLLREQLG